MTARQACYPTEHSKILAPKSKILLIRPSALGDVARTVPCLVTLRRAYPNAHIDWLVDARFADAVKAHPMLDAVVPFDRKDKRAALALMRRLRRGRYDLVIDLQGLARSGLFAWSTRASARVGYANARELGWLGVNHRYDIDPSRHAADRMLALLEAHGLPRHDDLQLHVPEDAQPFARDYVAQTNVLRRDVLDLPPIDGPYVCIAPTAQWGCKCWPIDRYIEITRRLLAENRAGLIMVLSAPNETDRIRAAFESLLPAELQDRISTPSTTVGQMMSGIEHAALLIGNDSAPLHLAVGLGTPTVSLFGPTDPAIWAPRGPMVRIITPPKPTAMDWLSVDALLEELGLE